MSDWWDAARRFVERETNASTEVQARRLQHLLRLGLIASLQSKGWFFFEGSTDYLEQFGSKWRNEHGAYRFGQLLQMLFVNGLSSPSRRARSLISKFVGAVPYLGSGLFESNDDEPVPSEAELEDWFWNEGILEAIELAKTGPSTSTVQTTTCLADALNVHYYESEAGRGQRATRQLTGVLQQLRCSDEWDDAITSKILERYFLIVSDELDAVEVRFKVAFSAFSAQISASPTPLPDIRQIVKVGKPIQAVEHTFGVESDQLEFKSSFEWNTRTHEVSADLRWGVLRTLAAFLNTAGGRVMLGVDDSGTPVGIDHELQRLQSHKPKDVFEGKLREHIKNHLDPIPLGAIDVEFVDSGTLTLCSLTVRPLAGVTYLIAKGPDGRQTEEVYVRDGARTLKLVGRARDRFVVARSR